ncbi:hypothetical protein VME0621_04758 [Vibrio mediterranei]|jgi:hypothetical protein|uniref:DUF1656 domain-containing protein n=1 Tax=Vibrio mediterranei TaxID=689 RepID=A0ABX5D6D8_9VIBR|nr:hypothetical protein VSAK1_19114 [Vibrio mediterranei AK1]NOH29728.1 hypothetical protein [Vibrio mediterranei]OIN27351.1 hypothetical protein AWH66_2011655 [Vibrio barjaei]PCD85348.1 hypothetical protein COR52_27190 [Vibrio mediterranei]PRQ65040.1 hypothetical protein COR51_24440 [Vibrio mediterranei]
MNDHIIFDYFYIPGFMVLVAAAIAILIVVKYTLGGLLRKGKIMNPSLTELCLVIIVTGQLLLIKVS